MFFYALFLHDVGPGWVLWTRTVCSITTFQRKKQLKNIVFDFLTISPYLYKTAIKQMAHIPKARLFITIFLDSTFPHNGHCHCHHRNHHTPTHHNQLQHHWTPSHLFKNWKLLSSWLQLQKSSAAVTNVILLHLKKKTWRHVQKKSHRGENPNKCN